MLTKSNYFINCHDSYLSMTRWIAIAIPYRVSYLASLPWSWLYQGQGQGDNFIVNFFTYQTYKEIEIAFIW